MTNVCIIATIVIYLVGMLLVGFVYSKSNEDSTDFYLLRLRYNGHLGKTSYRIQVRVSSGLVIKPAMSQ